MGDSCVVLYIPVGSGVVEPVRVDGASCSSEAEGQAAAGIVRVQDVDLVRDQRISVNKSSNPHVSAPVRYRFSRGLQPYSR